MEVSLSTEQIDSQIKVAAPLVGYSSEKRYATRANFLFHGINLSGAKVLEVGCGSGAWVIWAAINGAEQAVGLEPESDGSTPQTLTALRKTVDILGLTEKVLAFDYFLHQIPMEENHFDVIILFDVINHMNENAVIDLHHNKNSFKQFLDIAQDLRRRMKPGGWIIVADCGRTNFWNQVGLSSPLGKGIEWNKHQDPPKWIDVFSTAGFRLVDFRWSPLQPLTRITANWLVQYLTASHFVLRFQA